MYAHACCCGAFLAVYRMLVHRSYFWGRRLGGAPVRVFKLVGGGGGGQGTLRNRQHVRKIYRNYNMCKLVRLNKCGPWSE